MPYCHLEAPIENSTLRNKILRVNACSSRYKSSKVENQNVKRSFIANVLTDTLLETQETHVHCSLFHKSEYSIEIRNMTQLSPNWTRVNQISITFNLVAFTKIYFLIKVL